MEQYKFGCIAIIIACIFELTAEAPTFISQVFCFVKLKILLETLHIFIRSLIFIIIVMYNKEITIYAFGIAQLTMATTIVIGNYMFYYYYIDRLKQYRLYLKEHENKEKAKVIFGPYYENMDDFPFSSIKDMFPGIFKNEVSDYLRFQIILLTLLPLIVG